MVATQGETLTHHVETLDEVRAGFRKLAEELVTAADTFVGTTLQLKGSIDQAIVTATHYLQNLGETPTSDPKLFQKIVANLLGPNSQKLSIIDGVTYEHTRRLPGNSMVVTRFNPQTSYIYAGGVNLNTEFSLTRLPDDTYSERLMAKYFNDAPTTPRALEIRTFTYPNGAASILSYYQLSPYWLHAMPTQVSPIDALRQVRGIAGVAHGILAQARRNAA